MSDDDGRPTAAETSDDVLTRTELVAARDLVDERDRRRGLLGEAESTRDQARRRLRRARQDLADLTHEAATLQGLGARRMWASLSGARSTRLADLDRRRITAEHAVVEARGAVDAAVDEVHRHRRTVAELGDPDAEMAEVATAREALLLDSGRLGSAELGMVVDRLTAVRDARRRTAELRLEAQRAHSWLQSAAAQLDDAAERARAEQRRSIWATGSHRSSVSRGSPHTRRKHEHMTTADELVTGANELLAQLRERLELDDLEATRLSIRTDSLARFLDTWAGSRSSHRRVRGEIADSAARIAEAVERVGHLVASLSQREAEIEQEGADLAARREQLLAWPEAAAAAGRRPPPRPRPLRRLPLVRPPLALPPEQPVPDGAGAGRGAEQPVRGLTTSRVAAHPSGSHHGC